ncbi:MAG: ribosome recycling factor [Armatimonadetes bacterium]|nr:ribosome recycling factor [Armatimonadota bacterium]MDW8122047.1 ribosome recycling factor [Armatimonadota bacterium]
MVEGLRKVLTDAEERMKKTLQVAASDLASIRTGRATPALLDGIRVEYHGALYQIKELAQMSVPQARLLVLEPWDKEALEPIRKAIMNSPLGLNPVSDGKVLRIPIPPLTEERRRELIKVVNQRTEHSKVALRNIRKDALEEIRKLEKAPGVAEGMVWKAREELDKLTEKYTSELEKIRKAKEQEVLET